MCDKGHHRENKIRIINFEPEEILFLMENRKGERYYRKLPKMIISTKTKQTN